MMSPVTGDATAIAAARDATPAPASVDPADQALAGRTVTVAATDYGRDPVAGRLVGSSPHHWSIARDDDRAGSVVVHLPRLGFALTPAH
jgi:hypothetical protein